MDDSIIKSNVKRIAALKTRGDELRKELHEINMELDELKKNVCIYMQDKQVNIIKGASASLTNPLIPVHVNIHHTKCKRRPAFNQTLVKSAIGEYIRSHSNNIESIDNLMEYIIEYRKRQCREEDVVHLRKAGNSNSNSNSKMAGKARVQSTEDKLIDVFNRSIQPDFNNIPSLPSLL